MSTTPRIVADFESQLASAIAVAGTSFDLSSVTDDDGVALPDGVYCFTIDNGSSVKEYLMGSLVGSTVSSVQSISRQGAATSGAQRAHRVGASCIITDFLAIKRIADILGGSQTLDGGSPLSYDTAPSLSDGKQLATVAYVLSVVTGGSVSFSSQTIQGTAGETVTANKVGYFKTSDQRWWKADADTAATYDKARLGVFLGGASAGAGVAVQLSGIATGFTGLTPGSKYYVTDTAGEISTTPGTAKVLLGTAISTTAILLELGTILAPSEDQKDALAGGGYLGTPSSSNKFLTEAARVDIQAFTTTGTWSKPVGARFVEVILIGGGGGAGSGASNSTASNLGGGGGGGGGGYSLGRFPAAAVADALVTVGAGGVGGTAVSAGNGVDGGVGGDTSFGAYLIAKGGAAGSKGTTASVSSGTGGAGGKGAIPLATAGGTGGNSGNPPSAVSASDVPFPTGGGGGAGGSTNPGAAGGAIQTVLTRAGGAGGAYGGSAGSPGTSAANNEPTGGTGGGGGGGGSGGAGGTGGAGGSPGGGGGGGGNAISNAASGIGGAGGRGLALIITYM